MKWYKVKKKKVLKYGDKIRMCWECIRKNQRFF